MLVTKQTYNSIKEKRLIVLLLFFIFSANLNAVKNVGLRTSSKKIFFNGPNEARLLEYSMYQATKKIKD